MLHYRVEEESGFLVIKFSSLVTQIVKNLLAMQETQVQSMGREDSLEKEMTTHSRILAWRIPWTEEPGRLRSVGLQKRRTRLSDEATTGPARGLRPRV